MRILFICGSLEPGRDGVGDYSRRLSAALIKQGHTAAVVSLNDKYAKVNLFENQYEDGTEVSVLRLPAGLSSSQILESSKSWMDSFNADCYSLQYVPFAFHPKGLALQLGNLLLRIADKNKWHVMVHELWVGMDISAPKKQVLWGMLQRRLIKGLFAKLQPAVIHTQSLLYQQYLKRFGIHADVLPLFSNIPLMNGSVRKSAAGFENKKLLSMVLFGTLLPGAPVEDFIEEAMAYSVKRNIPASLRLVGRMKADEQSRWVNACKSAGLPVRVLGEQAPEDVSAVLTNASVGIATTAIALADKSGAVAAMCEHGLPVICVSAPWQPRIIKQLDMPAGLSAYKKGNLEQCIDGKSVSAEINTVSKVSVAFIQKLINAGFSNNNRVVEKIY